MDKYITSTFILGALTVFFAEVLEFFINSIIPWTIPFMGFTFDISLLIEGGIGIFIAQWVMKYFKW